MAQPPRAPRDTAARSDDAHPRAPLDRRRFLGRVTGLAGGLAGWGLLGGCQPAAGDARAAFAAEPAAGPALAVPTSAVPPTAHGMRFQEAGDWSRLRSQTARFVTRIGAGDPASAFTHYRADVPFGPDDMATYTAASTTWWIDPVAHWIAEDPHRRSVSYNWGLFPWEFVRQQPPNPGALDENDRVETAAKQLSALTSAALGGMDAHWRLQRDNVLARFDALLPDAAKPVRLIACVGIEVTGHWYPWGTSFQGDETGRTDDHAAQFGRAFRRMVQIYMERAGDHRIVFAYAPTHNAFLPGDYWASFRSLSWPGDDHVDLIMPTSYDCYYGGAYMNCRHLGDRTDAERDAWYAARWHEGVEPALAGMVRFATEGGRDKYLGLHEWGLYTEQTDIKDQYATPVPIDYARLADAMGGDNPVYIDNMFAFINDPANRVLLPTYFSELYKHDIAFMKQDDDEPHSVRHPRGAAAFKRHWQALPTTGSTAAVVDWLVARRSPGFGA